MILQALNLSFRYTSQPLLEETSFSVQEGELLCILGPNGSGKTTLLKCLNRILRPQGGQVLVDGQDCRTMGANTLARKLGWVPQHETASRITVYDLVLLGRKPYFRFGPTALDHEQVASAIALLGLDPLALRFADELSGGEFQLVQIARALAQNPRLILFDEPTSNLDISNQHHLLKKIKGLVQDGHSAAIICLHDINLALRYADRFLLLKAGQIQAAGTAEIIQPDIIRTVYGLETHVVEVSGVPIVIPVDQTRKFDK